MTSWYGAMTKDTLTHDVHGTKVRYLRTGHRGTKGPCISLCFSFTRVIESRVWHTRARLDRQQAVFSILNHIYSQTMNK